MDSVIEALQSGSDMVDDMAPETYAELIEQHFKTQYDNCDYINFFIHQERKCYYASISTG